MKKSRLIIIFLFIAIIIAVVGYIIINYLKDNQASSQIEEYIPQEEIAEEQLRNTMVNLYFYNKDLDKLEKESRLIESKELLNNPYKKLVQLLIDGPKSEKLKSLLPEDTNIIDANIDGNCVTLDMSIEFLNHTEDTDLKTKMIYSIVNTLTELTEVDSVKFLVNNKPNEEFKEEYIKL